MDIFLAEKIINKRESNISEKSILEEKLAKNKFNYHADREFTINEIKYLEKTLKETKEKYCEAISLWNREVDRLSLKRL